MAKQKSDYPNYTHVIIHRNDTLSDILYSIRHTKEEKVLVYLPDQMKTLSHVSNARILQRELERQSKQVVFCTPDSSIARTLESQGLSVETGGMDIDENEEDSMQDSDPFTEFFRSYPGEQTSSSSQREVSSIAHQKRKPWYAHFWAITGGLLLGVAVVVVAVMYYVPQATVTIAFTGEPIKKEYKVLFDPSQNEADKDNLIIPATVKRREGRVSKTFETSGQATEDKKTRLQLTVKNERGRAQSMAAQTWFRSSEGRIYKTQKSVVVPAGGEITVDVVANKPGYEYVLSQGARLEIPALATSRIYGVVDEVKETGSTAGTAYVSEKDRKNAQDELKRMLSQKLSKQIRDEAERKITLLNSAQIFEEVSYQRLPEAGTETKSFRPTLEAKIGILAYDETELLEMIREHVERQTPENKRLTDKVKLTFSEPLKGDLEEGITVRAFGEYTAHTRLDQNRVREDLTMKSFQEVRDYMQQFSGAKEVNVELSPKVWPRMPVFKRNITVETKGV